MSLSPAKKEIKVKSEAETTPLTSQSSSNSTPKPSSSSDGWQDIPLKSCTKEEVSDIRYHIMKFQSTRDVDVVEDFTKPVRLHRKDPRNIQFQLTRQEIDRRKKQLAIDKANGVVHEPTEEELIAEDEAAIARGEEPRRYPRADMSQVAPDGGARRSKKNIFKKKTRQISLVDDAKRKLRYEEYYPWVIEDYDGSNVFVGNYEAGASDTQHVLFVFDKDGFKMVPAEKVYKFTPRNKYATLTLEEAEAKMEKNSSVPRWLMKHMEEKSIADNTQDSRFRGSAPGNGIVAPASTNNSRRLRTVLGGGSNDRDSDHDDLDFDEEFADDEEAPIMDGDEEENKLSERRVKKEMLKAAHFDGQSDAEIDDELDDLFETEKSRKVDKEGKKLRKVLNKTEGGVYDSEDDDQLNPYLSKSDLESDDESDDEPTVKQEDAEGVSKESDTKKSGRSLIAQNVGDGFVVIKAPAEFLNTFPKGNWIPNGRKRPAPVLASPKKKAKVDGDKSPKKIKSETERSISPTPIISLSVDLDSSGPDGVLVTIKEVLNMVKNNPLTTKELLLSLKTRVNAHRDNKQRIISIVKQNLKLVDGKLVLKE
ncbi:Rap30/74 interaction domain-containing protein [Suhomyces tanzawaensis NRRL Y-17324]|uniref:Transcription initiation factor IIF subunit alpha n=1 Tax=Suhomyces tanzawaensis NRRL Y-17324 TaxID=984487 RepID=A0A1E4SM79_9ASCO|nr:Rap30/74 interaction domain-containing protein [Suhomyces tanzawaensis NRRL Y-17324]ODV80492.1 Rap30/74 interaction domain-containing protein [Suhomyces tanzawaensis NRRL Y-17324]